MFSDFPPSLKDLDSHLFQAVFGIFMRLTPLNFRFSEKYAKHSATFVAHKSAQPTNLFMPPNAVRT